MWFSIHLFNSLFTAHYSIPCSSSLTRIFVLLLCYAPLLLLLVLVSPSRICMPANTLNTTTQESGTKISIHKCWAKDKKELKPFSRRKIKKQKATIYIIEMHSIIRSPFRSVFCFVHCSALFLSVVLVLFCATQKIKWNLDTLAINTQ